MGTCWCGGRECGLSTWFARFSAHAESRHHEPGDQACRSTLRRRLAHVLFGRDLLASLAWIEAEIGNFGGDEDRVTVFGPCNSNNRVS